MVALGVGVLAYLAGTPGPRSAGFGAGGEAIAGCADCGIVEQVVALQPQEAPAAGREAGRSTSFALLGALGGAKSGTQQGPVADPRYRVMVRMEDGTTRTVYSVSQPGFAVGARVRVVNGGLAAR